MTLEASNMEKEVSSDRLRVAVVGEQKAGKSWLESTAPGVKFFFDYDQRKASLSGKKGVYAVTLRDPVWPKMPEAAEETLDLVSGLEASLDLSLLKDKRGNRILPDVPPGTLVENVILDSIQSMAKCFAYFEMYNNADLRRTIQIGTGASAVQVFVQKSFDAWNAEMKQVEGVIMRLFALPVNVFCSFHEAAEEANDSTNENPKYTGKITVYPVRYRNILQYFNEVWRVKLVQIAQKQGPPLYLPRVFPLPDFSMNCTTAMLLDSIEEPNIEAMIAKHRVRSGQTKSLPAAQAAVK
jgi:hypothetical protein